MHIRAGPRAERAFLTGTAGVLRVREENTYHPLLDPFVGCVRQRVKPLSPFIGLALEGGAWEPRWDMSNCARIVNTAVHERDVKNESNEGSQP